jgi:hypothetical protein
MQGWLVGVLMIVMGGLSFRGFDPAHPPTRVGFGIAVFLVVAGALLFLRRPFAWWIGIAAAGVTLVSGIVAQAGKPELGLPTPPLLAIVIGLYLGFRLLTSRAYFYKKREET